MVSPYFVFSNGCFLTPYTALKFLLPETCVTRGVNPKHDPMIHKVSVPPTFRLGPYLYLQITCVEPFRMSTNQEEHVTNDLVADDNPAPDEAQQILVSNILSDFHTGISWYSQDDGDSGYAQSGSNITASLASSIMRFRQENGRTYHSYREGSKSDFRSLDIITRIVQFMSKLHIRSTSTNCKLFDRIRDPKWRGKILYRTVEW
jgi:hypothetical protein